MDHATSIQWLQCSVLPAHLPIDLGFLGLVLSNYLVEQTERQAVHHFVVCAMQAPEPMPRFVVWVFQPLVTLSIPPLERSCDACKLLYKPCTTQPHISQHIPLVLPAEICDALCAVLQDSSQIYPASRRALGDWHVGWLPRRWI